MLDYFKETGGKYWNGDCFVFDERVALDTDLNETEYIYCYICREPLSAEEKASPDFKINEYCPYCIKRRFSRHRKTFDFHHTEYVHLFHKFQQI